MCRLVIRGAASADLLLRVLDVVAQRGFMPERMAAIVTDGEMRIELEMPGLAGHLADTAVAKIRTLVGIASVEPGFSAPAFDEGAGLRLSDAA